MAIAREEGHAVKMYPGVSALDCLFADLEVDPARLGCAIYEARDLLVRERPLLLSSHVILLQVWVVGISDYSYGGYKVRLNTHLGVLIAYRFCVRTTRISHFLLIIWKRPTDRITQSFTIPRLSFLKRTLSLKSMPLAISVSQKCRTDSAAARHCTSLRRQ